MTDQNNQQTKYNPRGKAIASLILGIISLILFMAWIIDFWYFTSPDGIRYYFNYVLKKIPLELRALINIFQIPLLPIFGLILGIFGLKSTRKKFAITGIMLCSISLIGSLLLLLWGFLYSLGL